MPNTRGRIPPSGAFSTDSAQLASVANLTELAAVLDADLCWVQSLLCYFHRQSTSTLAPDGITIVTAAAGGNWERIVETTGLDWLSQIGWTIDPATGNDENAGGAAAPLATFDELQRRLSVGVLATTALVTIAAGASVPHCWLDVDVGENAMLIEGQETVVATDAVATFADRNHATPESALLTAAAIADWTPYVGMRLRMTSGTALGAIAWVARANPHAAGVDVASISQFTGDDGLPYNPSPGDTFVIETLPSIGDVVVQARSGGTGLLTQRFRIKSCKLGQSVAFETLLAEVYRGVILDGCNVTAASSSLPVSVNGGATGTALWMNRCAVQDVDGGLLANVRSAGCLFRACGSALQLSGGVHPLVHGALLCDDAGLVIWGDQIGFSSLQCFNATSVTNAIQTRCSELVLADAVSGDGNGVGLEIGTGAGGTAPGCNVCYSSSYNLLGTVDIQITGYPETLAVADLPYNGNSQKGIATLVGGTVTVTARGSVTRGVLIARNTPAGAAMGLLTAPEASRTLTDFVINAEDIAGSGLVVTDVSTVDWYIPEEARGIRIYNARSAGAAA